MALSANDRVLLADLTKQPGWAILAATVEEQADKKVHRYAQQLMHTLEPIDERQLYYDRGYWQAMRDLVEKPERAARTLIKE